MSDLDKDMRGGRIRRLGSPQEPDDAARLRDLAAISSLALARPAAVYPGWGGGGGPGPPGPQGPQGPAGTGAGGTVVSAIGVSTGGNTAGDTGTTVGTYVLAGAGGITLSQATAPGALATITISGGAGAPAVTAIGVSTGGNTAGTTGTTQGTYVLAGGNQITLSQSTAVGGSATVTISARDAVFGAGISTGGNTSGTSGTNTGTFVLAGIGNITLSQATGPTGNTITISGGTAAAGGVLAIGVSTGGNTSGTTGTTTGTYVLAGGNQITLSQSTAPGGSATVTISARDAVFGAGISTGGNTSGTSGTNTGTFVLVGINGITLSQATGAGGNTITISGITQSVQPAVTAIGVSTGGNTSGTTGTTQGTYVLAGGNNITLSQSTAVGSLATVTISAANSGTVVSGIGVSTGGNTSGSTGTTVGTVVFAGGNQITLSQSTAVGSLATITISGRDAVFGAGISTGGNTSGTSGTNTGTFVLVGINGITLSQATGAGGNTVTISGITQSVQPAVTAIGVSTGGNTAGTTGTTQGTYVLAGGNQITLSQSTAAGSLATVTISGRDAVFGVGVSTGGNTSGTTGTTLGTYVLAGGNNITLSQSTAAGSLATVTISAANSATVVSGLGVSTGGNTSGSTGTTLGTIVFAGGNQITLSQSTAAGSLATITISGRDAVFGAGVSTGGNTSGTTGTVTGTFVLAGGANITLSQSTDGAGATVTISGAAGGGGTVVSAIGVSTGGNTSGSTGTTVGTYVLVGINNITLSQSTAAGSLATVTISGPALVSVNLFQHPQADWHATNFTISNATFSLQRVSLPAHITATRLELLMDLTGNTNSTGALTISVGAYTMSGSTASLSTSASRQISWSSGSATTASTIYGGVSGTRYRTVEWSITMTPGDYLFGFWMRTTNNGTWRAFGPAAVSIVGALDANETNVFLDGTSVSSFTTAMPSSINVTDTNYARTGAVALRQPGFLVMGSL
jgi:hypothetical protein